MHCSNVGRARLGRSILAGIVIAAGYGCDGCPGETEGPPPPPPPPPPPAARTVEVRAREFELIPNRISAGPEEALNIVLINEGTMVHSIEFELPPPIGDVDLEPDPAPGERGELTFTTPAANGDYEYYCPVDGHRALGMVGQLTVEPQIELGLRPIAEGLTSPLTMAFPDDSGRALIVDQIGLIRVLTPEGQLLDTPFLDVRDRMVTLDPDYDERGLLGLALHPDYASNGRFFVYYSAPLRAGAPAGWDHTSCVVEYTVSAADANVADPSSERILLEVDKPQSNHNGGTVAFGPDGYLYISIGDGGAANDVGLGHAPQGNGQDITTMLGKIHRIDVNGVAPYAIPPDNPFVGVTGLDEIYAYGFRNPYRMSFDMDGGALFVGDAGQDLWEEVSMVERGGNYGWRIREGTHCFDPDNPLVSPLECPTMGAMGEPLMAPIVEYSHHAGEAVVGGYVYRGDAIPGLQGRYLFGDYTRNDDAPEGSLFSSPPRPAEFGVWPIQRHRITNRPNGELGLYVLGFAQDPSGEMYAFMKEEGGPTGATGRVYKIVPAVEAQP